MSRNRTVLPKKVRPDVTLREERVSRNDLKETQGQLRAGHAPRGACE